MVSTLSRLRARADRLTAEHDHALRQVTDEERALAQAQEHLAHVEEARRITQQVAAGVQRSAHGQMSRVVSRCLEAVFDEPYALEIAFEGKRGRTEAKLQLVRGEARLADPSSSAGGGVIDVAAFALRLACLALSRPKKRRLLLLDEPMRMVSANFRPRVCQLLETLAKELDVQIVLVTHSEEFMAGKVIRL